MAVLLVLWGVQGLAGEPALLRVERSPEVSRDGLIEAGLDLVAEMSGCFLVVGDERAVAAQAAERGLSSAVLDPDTSGWHYAIVGLRSGWSEAELETCGEALWFEDQWALVRAGAFDLETCHHSPQWFFRPLSLEPLRTTRGRPEGLAERVVVKPMVQEMVNAMTDAVVVDTWTAVVGSASTRYSTSAGCVTAANHVYAIFDSLGLEPQLVNHTGGHAPNVVGTLPGVTNPDDVYIVIGHLDDLPSSGPAPGADDNASGSATVVSLAKIMSQYRFASTVKFLAVTGEEFGLYGSDHYADQAWTQGENILAVLNADMNGWEGDGIPTAENLDLNYNSSSQWLANLFVQAASDYGTGCPINAFLCSSMVYSDHAPFWDHGWSAVCGITDNEGFCGQAGDYPYYHQSSDTIANCGDPAFFASSVRAYLATAGHLADPLCRQPDPPVGVAATGNGANQILVSWTPGPAGLSYEVYRAPEGCSGPLRWVKVGESSTSSYLDTTASGGVLYAYVVLARDATAFCISAASACTEASTTGDCLEAPGFDGVAAVTDDHQATCTLTVGWLPAQPYCGAGVTYSVYRSQTQGFAPSDANRIAAGVVATSYEDSADLQTHQTYYYIVRAVDQLNGAEDLNTVEASGFPTGPLTIGTWSDDAGDTSVAKLELDPPWAVAGSGGHGGPKVYATGQYSNDLCVAATTPQLYVGTGAVLSFWSKYDIEPSWDKGEVQISTDGGTSWQRVSVSYPGYSTHTGDECGLPDDTWYFTGTNLTWAEYSASLAQWEGQDVLIRWLLSTDVYVTGAGWWVDDISITNVAVPGPCSSQPQVPLFADDFETGNTSAWPVTVP